jgi:hypothetical protein
VLALVAEGRSNHGVAEILVLAVLIVLDSLRHGPAIGEPVIQPSLCLDTASNGPGATGDGGRHTSASLPVRATGVSQSDNRTTKPPGSSAGRRSCRAQFRPHGSAAKRRMYFLDAEVVALVQVGDEPRLHGMPVEQLAGQHARGRHRHLPPRAKST